MAKYRIGYLIGSLSTHSINRKLAGALVRLAPDDLDLVEIPIRDLVVYSQDYDADFPPAAVTFKARFANVDALLIVTPEYNRSIPGGLKNAIDWGTRGGSNVFAGKPTGVAGTSPGALGSAFGQHALRDVLRAVGAPVMLGPDVALQFKPDLINDQGEITVDRTRDFLQRYMVAFRDFVARELASRSAAG